MKDMKDQFRLRFFKHWKLALTSIWFVSSSRYPCCILRFFPRLAYTICSVSSGPKFVLALAFKNCKSFCLRTTYRKLNLERCPFPANTYIHIHLPTDIASKALFLSASVLTFINQLAFILLNFWEVFSHNSLVRHLLSGNFFIVASLSFCLRLDFDRVVVLDNSRVLNGRNIAAVMEGFHLANGRSVLREAVAAKVDMAIWDGLDHGWARGNALCTSVTAASVILPAAPDCALALSD